MTPEYDDIKSRIAEPPTWYDDNGTPRYGAFHPDNAPNIYAREVALVQIGCQNCDQTWLVSITRSHLDDVRTRMMGGEVMTLGDAIDVGDVHYGDPPSHVETDHAGSTMNCIDWRVVEYWHKSRETDNEWKRDPSREVLLRDWHDETWIDRRPKLP